MKKTTAFIIVSFVFLFVAMSVHAQNINNFSKQQWQERLLSEKIAFLTNEMSLTPQEAQVFWPIYNQAQREQEKATADSFRTFAELERAIRENKSEDEIKKLLNAYTTSLDNRDVSAKYVKEYLKVLSSEKVAKLYIGEEKFRQSKIFGLRQPQMMGGQSQAKPWGKPQQDKNK